jgi:hypothetical protein
MTADMRIASALALLLALLLTTSLDALEQALKPPPGLGERVCVAAGERKDAFKFNRDVQHDIAYEPKDVASASMIDGSLIVAGLKPGKVILKVSREEFRPGLNRYEEINTWFIVNVTEGPTTDGCLCEGRGERDCGGIAGALGGEDASSGAKSSGPDNSRVAGGHVDMGGVNPEGDYGAIALSRTTLKFGVSDNAVTREEAEKASMKSCGRADCEVLVWIKNAYAALAIEPKFQKGVRKFGWRWANSKEEAERSAIENCAQLGGKDCAIVSSISTARSATARRDTDAADAKDNKAGGGPKAGGADGMKRGSAPPRPDVTKDTKGTGPKESGAGDKPSGASGSAAGAKGGRDPKESRAGGASGDRDDNVPAPEPVLAEEAVVLRVGQERKAKFSVQSYITRRNPENTDPSVVEVVEFKADFGLTVRGLKPGRATITTLFEKIGLQAGINVPLQKNVPIKKIFNVLVLPAEKEAGPSVDRIVDNITLAVGKSHKVRFNEGITTKLNTTSSAEAIASVTKEGNVVSIKGVRPGNSVVKITATLVEGDARRRGGVPKREEFRFIWTYNVKVINGSSPNQRLVPCAPFHTLVNGSRANQLPPQSLDLEYGSRGDESYFRGRLTVTPGYCADVKEGKPNVNFFWFAGASKEKDFFNLDVLDGKAVNAPSFFEQRVKAVRAKFDTGGTVAGIFAGTRSSCLIPIPTGATKLMSFEMDLDFGGKTLVWSSIRINLYK